MTRAAEEGKGLRQKKVFGLKKWQYVAINAFLVFHILAISCWCLPISNPFILACRSAVRPYFVWSGLFQSWERLYRSDYFVQRRLDDDLELSENGDAQPER